MLILQADDSFSNPAPRCLASATHYLIAMRLLSTDHVSDLETILDYRGNLMLASATTTCTVACPVLGCATPPPQVGEETTTD